jgi:hypothetical protein
LGGRDAAGMRARTVHLAVGRISQGFEKETGTHVHVLVAGTYRE